MSKIYVLSLVCALGIITSAVEAGEFTKRIDTLKIARAEKDIQAKAAFNRLSDYDKQRITNAAKLMNTLKDQYLWNTDDSILTGRYISPTLPFSETHNALRDLTVEERSRIKLIVRSKKYASTIDSYAAGSFATISYDPDHSAYYESLLKTYPDLITYIQPLYIKFSLGLTGEAQNKIEASKLQAIDLIRARASEFR